MAFGADRSVKVNLQANVTDFIGKITAAQKKTLDLSRDISKMSDKQKQSWDKIGKGALIAGAGIVAALGGAAKAYMNFEAAMSGVAAVADANTHQLEALSQAAIKAGAATVFSASEAAKAEAELAKAGVSVEDILGGGLNGALNLAAAGQIDLAEAAEISAKAMNIFALKGADVGHIADVLTAGANKSAAGVGDLGQALAQGGLLARQTGLSLEETVGALSAFADNALVGSDAGTSLKTMLQRLTPTTDKAAELMDNLGLRAYDAQGNFVGLATYSEKLRKALSGMTAEQRNATMNTLFGSDAVRAANILYEEGAAGVNTYVAAVNDIGAAQRMAARQTDNLKGDIEQLKGSLETAFIGAGSGGNDALRSLAQSVTDLVNKFNEMSPAAQANVVKVAALTAGALLLAGGAIKATTSVLSLKASLDAAGISASRTGKGLATVGKVAGIAGASLAALAQADRALFDGPGAINARRLSTEVERASGSLDAINASFREAGKVADGFDSRIGTVNDALRATFDPSHWQQVGDQLNEVFSIFGRENTSDVAVAGQRLGEVDAALTAMVSSGKADQASQAFFQIQQAASKQGISLADLQERFPQYMEAVDSASLSASSFSDSQQGMSDNLQLVADRADEAEKALDDYVKSLIDSGLVVLNRRDAEREVADALAEVSKQLKENGRTVDENTSKGRDNLDFLDGAAKKHLDLAEAVFKETGSEDKFRKSLIESRKQLIDTATRLGMTKKDAEAYADSILNIPPAKSTKITANGLPEATRGVQQLKLELAGLKGKTVTVTTRYSTEGQLPNGGRNLQGGILKADGGFISGPGTATSDSIPAYLSNGEYVIKAAAVAKYGTSLFDQLNTMRFASGGFVGGSVPVSNTHTETNTAPVYIDKVMGPDLASIEAEAERRRRLDALGQM